MKKAYKADIPVRQRNAWESWIAEVRPQIHADLASIRRDMLEDPFLKNITPRWPATQTRIHGYRTGLDSSERYE